MSGVEAFALACNVLQVVDSAVEIASACKEVYQEGQARPELVSCSEALDAAYTSLEQNLRNDPILVWP